MPSPPPPPPPPPNPLQTSLPLQPVAHPGLDLQPRLSAARTFVDLSQYLILPGKVVAWERRIFERVHRHPMALAGKACNL